MIIFLLIVIVALLLFRTKGDRFLIGVIAVGGILFWGLTP